MAPALSPAVQEDLTLLATRVVPGPHQLMLRSVAARAAAIGEKLARCGDAKSMDATKSFHEAVEALAAFVTTFAQTHKFVYHLASMREMWLSLHLVGTKLDNVVTTAGLKETGEVSWQKQLMAAREQEEDELSKKAAKNALPFARNMRPNEPMEALTLLKYEIDFFKAKNSTKHVASMKKVFFSVVRSSNGRVAKIPDSYIPPHAVNYSRDDKNEMEGSVGSAYRGIWVDRKPADGKKPETDEEGGEQQPTTQNVVVKRLFFHADSIEFFRREVEIWSGLDHPNILKLYGASHCSYPALLICEDAANGPLVNYLTQQQPQRIKEEVTQLTWKLLLEAAYGLKYLHENRLVHGNMKSDNILVAADGFVKLTDFGMGMFALQNQAIQNNKFQELGWRAPNCRQTKLFRRSSFQDDIYCFGLCVLDVLVPQYSSIRIGGFQNEPHIGELNFDPLSKQVMQIIPDEGSRKLIIGMCNENPDSRLSLKEVISSMTVLLENAAIKSRNTNVAVFKAR